MEEAVQAASLVLRVIYFLIGVGLVHSGIALIAGRGNTPGRLEERVPLKRIPSKARIPYGLYYLVLGPAISLCVLFVPAVWPWMVPALLPFFLFPVFVIYPGLKRQAAGLGRAGPHDA